MNKNEIFTNLPVFSFRKINKLFQYNRRFFLIYENKMFATKIQVGNVKTLQRIIQGYPSRKEPQMCHLYPSIVFAQIIMINYL